MRVIIEKREGVTLLIPLGYMVNGNINSFREIIKDIQNEKIKNVIINLGRIRMIDSEGFTVMVYLVKICRLLGGDVKLASMRNHIEEIYMMMRLNKVIASYPSTDDALQSFVSKEKSRVMPSSLFSGIINQALA